MASSSSSASVRQRPSAAAAPAGHGQQQQPIILQDEQQQQQDQAAAAAAAGEAPPPPPPQTSSALSQALASTANLANLLPTGTLLAFNLLAPTFTNHGACDATTSLLTRCLLAVLALASALACFTDSLKSPHDGHVYYGVATRTGLWLIDYPPDAPPLPTTTASCRYRLAFIDFVHAALSAAVFGVVAARDRDVVACLCGPTPRRETKELIDVLPLGVGVLCSLLFVAFPTRRHGIGYPVVVVANGAANSS
ncbi:hypothetical protein BDA96_07G005900 [Sorghum bicolor]|jgi:hypothetical protein|uniref:DUF679 domain-containing protein n=2 Tax=Sorghum bicolor TaxID=4558 RepID=C5YLH1_SORBI|nr:uncharacterized protein LOC8068513 [Sorghum bicolor]EES14365.1 hypothetical protein SORBI_3007G005600 [Sorghum bicolor]KAG0522080.1 hypothetical protein BDA96_07G005900 [Sorghum bicolor]|eukprot:XP_002444870.1 uncharacterized protein LOC8068513 [Sorghum bicolor]